MKAVLKIVSNIGIIGLRMGPVTGIYEHGMNLLVHKRRQTERLSASPEGLRSME
jgi:hypothetical protein